MKKKIIGITVGTTMNPDKFGGSDVDLSDYAKKEDLNLKADLVDGKIPIEQLPDGIVSGGFTPDVPVPDISPSVDITKVVANAEFVASPYNSDVFEVTNIEPSYSDILSLINQGADVEIHCKLSGEFISFTGELVLNLEAFDTWSAKFSKVTRVFESDDGVTKQSMIFLEFSSNELFNVVTAGRRYIGSRGGSGGDSSDGDSSSGGSGKDGKSAYEIAVDNGFEGTVTEWLDSLKGEKGDKGDTYTLTNDDKNDIADVVIAKLPVWQGGSY